MIRDEFEKLFPVPLHVVWNPAQGAYTSGSHFFSDIAEAYQGAWVGFQAGHAAGLEDARSEYARTHVTVRVPAHSDSTEQ